MQLLNAESEAEKSGAIIINHTIIEDVSVKIYDGHPRWVIYISPRANKAYAARKIREATRQHIRRYQNASSLGADLVRGETQVGLPAEH